MGRWGCWRAAAPPANTPTRGLPFPAARGEGARGWGALPDSQGGSRAVHSGELPQVNCPPEHSILDILRPFGYTLTEIRKMASEWSVQMRQALIQNQTRGTLVAQEARVASSWWARLRGLIGRHELRPGQGLIIRPCSSIHTFFMSFPIDVVFVDKGNRVLQATHHVVPWRIGPIVPHSHYVIELPAGAIQASTTEPGDVLSVQITEGKP